MLAAIVIGFCGPATNVAVAQSVPAEPEGWSLSLRPQYRWVQDGGGSGSNGMSEPSRGEQPWDGDGVLEPGEDEIAELARAVQNPVADLISLPFQNITLFEVGPRNRAANVLNIQPVIPVAFPRVSYQSLS